MPILLEDSLRIFAFNIALLTGLSLVIASSDAALAADSKPDASIKTKAIEADVFLDARIKADPALSADCLAEGRKWIAPCLASEGVRIFSGALPMNDADDLQ